MEVRLLIPLLFATAAHAQYYFAGLGGTVALSPGSTATPGPPASAMYDPKLGPAANVAAGRHLTDWFSVQINYIWNQNRLVYSEIGGGTFSRRESTETQHAATADLLVYFRERGNWVRPYLAGGTGRVHALGRNLPGLRVAVGADLVIRAGWAFRYSFSETISSNPYSEALRPPGGGKLMTFQNLFGIVRVF
jgi:hypothetical protein